MLNPKNTYMENLQSAPVTGPVTDQERAYAIDSLNVTKDALHQSLAGLSDAQLTYKPTADSWSVAECVEHIALVEKRILYAIQASMDAPTEPEKRAEIKVSDVDVIKAVRSRTTRLSAPDHTVPTGHFGDTATALAAFDAQRTAAISYVETVSGDLRTHYFTHFVLGQLDAYQAVLLMSAHCERHRKQIEAVKTNPDYPVTGVSA